MRRKDREITDQNEILEIIKRCDTCRLAINNGDFPYIIPLNFGEEVVDDQLYFYFHSANEGMKLDLLHANNKVSFEMDCNHNIILYDERMSCTMGYESVIGKGIVEFIEDYDEKLRACRVLMRHFHDEEFPFNEKMVNAIAVFRLKVIELTAKRRNNIHPEEKVARNITL